MICVDTQKSGQSLIDCFKADWALVFDVEPVPKALFVEGVFALEDEAVVVGSPFEADPAVLVLCLNLGLFCEVDEEHGGEYLGEHFFDEVDPPEEGVGDADEDKVEAAEVEDKGVEEDLLVCSVPDELENEDCRHTPDCDKD
jgi:hypothetical protein